MMGWWATLLAMSDQDRDDKVSLDELTLVVDQLGSMDAEVMATADSMFDAIDENGDGLIAVEIRRIQAQPSRRSATRLTVSPPPGGATLHGRELLAESCAARMREQRLKRAGPRWASVRLLLSFRAAQSEGGGHERSRVCASLEPRILSGRRRPPRSPIAWFM